MKKILFTILLLSGIWSCTAPEQKTTDGLYAPQYNTEIKDTLHRIKISMTLDSLKKMATDSGLLNLRAANDAVFDIEWLADNFNNQNKWFFDSLCNQQEALLKVTAPFDSLFRIGKLKFIRKVAQGNFNCKSAGGIDAALDCNWGKVSKAAFSDGMSPDYIHIFSYNNGFGTGNGGLSITGVGNESLLSSPWFCIYWIREPRITAHEMGHGLGLAHAFIPQYPLNFMAQATNGGCELGSVYLPFQQQIILAYINSKL